MRRKLRNFPSLHDDSKFTRSVFFALQIAFSGFTQISAHIIPLANAAAAGGKLFGEIDSARRQTGESSGHSSSSANLLPAKASSENGDQEKKEITALEPAQTAPAIVYENVSFAYPTRPDVTVLHNFSCHFEAGKMTAVVGRSGSGKSTLVGLLEKWYRPTVGNITVDGKALDTLDSKSLRVGIGYVQQVRRAFLGRCDGSRNSSRQLPLSPRSTKPLVIKKSSFGILHDSVLPAARFPNILV